MVIRPRIRVLTRVGWHSPRQPPLVACFHTPSPSGPNRYAPGRGPDGRSGGSTAWTGSSYRLSGGQAVGRWVWRRPGEVTLSKHVQGRAAPTARQVNTPLH